jgi:tetratricopeptide (TPR) repeat protein
MHVDHGAPPRMFVALHRWALSLRDLGELASAVSAAESLCREAGSRDELTVAYRLLAELNERSGDLAAARGVREVLVDLARSGLAADPTTERRFLLLAALDELGDLARQQSDHWGVLACYGNQGRMPILRDLTGRHGDRAALLTEQCFSLRRAGTAARELGALDEARALFEERLTVARLTFAGNPAETQLLALVAAALADLGPLLARLGDPRAAALLSEELSLRQWLQQLRPDDVRARQELATCHLALTSVGPDTGQHLRIATTLLSQIEAEGQLDVPGRIMLSGLRSS